MSNPEKPSFSKQPLFLIIPLLFSYIFISSTALAERASFDEMDNVCRNWLEASALQSQGWRDAAAPEISSIENIIEGGILVGRIYDIAPKGFVVVPVLKEMPPVMAYSDKYNLDYLQDEGMRALIAEVLYDRARLFIEAYGDIDASQPETGEVLLGREDRRLWNMYSLPTDKFIASLKAGVLPLRSEEAGPLLTTAWHQGYPYNIFCPTGYDDRRCVVGCVATAAAQIVYYWQWPAQGTGSRMYMWGGDNSCDTSTSGKVLAADYSDPYIYDTAPENLAELNYEMGVAFNMQYGVCGSGAYVETACTVFPSYFKYMPSITQRNRSAYGNAAEWYNLVKEEIDAGRPMQYRISRHSIVCDGYRESGGMLYYHMNYGWGGSMNAWFAIDNVYCSWDGCNFMTEFMICRIEPNWVWPSSDATFGAAPLEINFDAETELDVDSWTWNFGDGEFLSGNYRTAQHTYDAPGIYDLTVEINVNGQIHSATRYDYITIIADTLSAGNAEGEVGDAVEIAIDGTNTIPVSTITIPLKYSGGLLLRYDSCSTIGCRTEEFSLDEISLGSGFIAFELACGSQELEPGNGTLLKAYFTILSGTSDKTTPILLDNIGSYYPEYRSTASGLEYNPATEAGLVTFPRLCGDTDGDNAINILDIVYLINFIYKSGPPPVSPDKVDVNSDAAVNILDIVYLINHIYKEGPQPVCP